MPKAIDWMDVLTRWFSLPLVKKQEYREIAAGYSRCAVGEQRQRFPKVVVYSREGSVGKEKVPMDSTLYDLGYDFYQHLSHATDIAQSGFGSQYEAQDIAEATNVITKIRARVAALKEAAK
jgi:hypothetical protein